MQKFKSDHEYTVLPGGAGTVCITKKEAPRGGQAVIALHICDVEGNGANDPIKIGLEKLVKLIEAGEPLKAKRISIEDGLRTIVIHKIGEWDTTALEEKAKGVGAKVTITTLELSTTELGRQLNRLTRT